jgi:hypothetical protein
MRRVRRDVLETGGNQSINLIRLLKIFLVDAATNSAPAGFPPLTWRLETEPSRGPHSFVWVIIEQKWERRCFRMWGRKVGAPLLPRVWKVGATAGGEGGWAPLLQREADIVILRRSNVVLQNLQGERCRGDDDTIVELWQT